MLIRSAFQVSALAAAFVAAGVVTAMAAPEWTGWGQIIEIEAGWVADSAALRLSSTGVVNPSGCPVTDYGYVTNPADPGHSWFHTIALSALVSGKPVALLIDGCYADKPRVISIKVVP
jgi:hypothetical protein